MIERNDWMYFLRRACRALAAEKRSGARSFTLKAQRELVDAFASRRVTRASYNRAMRIIEDLYAAADGIVLQRSVGPFKG